MTKGPEYQLTQGRVMNNDQRRFIQSVLNEYETSTEKFQELISNHQNVTEQIKAVRLIECDENSLIIDIFGIEVTIQFSMVFQGERSTLGQVTALVDMQPFNSVSELKSIYTVWFDYLGNITSSPSGGADLGHVSYADSLPSFIHSVAYNLIKSELMAPLQ